MAEQTETETAWLQPEDLRNIRERVPMVYVDAVPVRVDGRGEVSHVGLLLRMSSDGTVSRCVVSGRVLYGERVRDALIRHLEKDLGPLALPRLPPSPAPFTVAEYFPEPEVTGYHDPRQHAVSLVFVVPVDGDCQPSQESLDITWVTPAEALGDGVRYEMAGGHGRLVRLALAHAGWAG